MAKRNASNQLTHTNWDDEDEAEEAGVFKAADEGTLKTRQIKTAKRRAPTAEGGTAGAFKGFAGFGAKATPSAATAPAFSFGTKGLPGLGATSNGGDKPSTASGFTFGSLNKDAAKSEADSTVKPAAASFKFTSSSTTTETKSTFGASAAGFSFGAKSTDSKDAPKPLSSSITFGKNTPSQNYDSITFSKHSPNKYTPITFSDSKPSQKLDSITFTDSNPKKYDSITFGKSSSGEKSATDSKSETSLKKNGSSSNPKYLAKLKGLNEAVAKWIKNHVDDNPYILLTPIFKDYEKYLEKIESENPEKSSADKTASVSDSNKEKSTESSSGFSFNTKSPVATETAKPAESSTKTETPFSFGSTAKASSGLGSGFSFGSSSTTASSVTSGFSFKSSDSTSGGTPAPFSFATGATSGVTPAAPATTGGDGGEEEYVPPKPESVEIKEDDALYTKRCKMFFQKEGNWTERGVGNIYLKPMDNKADKTQLLIRADNSLGTVLLNIVLSNSIPMKRQGKNNVSLICTPNPPLDPKSEEPQKPASLLLRVKTSQDADDLLQQLNKHKS